MKKLFIPLVAVLCLGLLVGCKSTPQQLTKALYVTTVSSGIALGADRYPSSVPYLRVAAPIICAAGNSTNISPAEIVAALQNSPAANAVATQEGKLILNGALILYVSAYEAYGADYVDHHEQLRNYLQWTCESFALGLPAAPNTHTNATVRSLLRKPLPPHVR